ncbi:MAG: hypothetical protein CSA03_00175 [Bacteroidetes bacterium]|nr:MAG: hypothetical protein CSA03_00175 [Bacteroidota bacterium]
MRNRPNLLALIVTLTYWIPSTIVLFSIIEGSGSKFPVWLDLILTPGYILGFFLGFGGGKAYAILGQIITFVVIFFFTRVFTIAWNRKKA